MPLGDAKSQPAIGEILCCTWVHLQTSRIQCHLPSRVLFSTPKCLVTKVQNSVAMLGVALSPNIPAPEYLTRLGRWRVSSLVTTVLPSVPISTVWPKFKMASAVLGGSDLVLIGKNFYSSTNVS